VALARALAPRPKVLLLDEPFGALDAKVRRDLRQWLDELHREIGVTSLLVTHDQEEALELANQIVVMHEGKVEQVGSLRRSTTTRQHRSSPDSSGPRTCCAGQVVGGEVHLGSFALPGAAPGGWGFGRGVRQATRHPRRG
jgi:sulfate transport system ATP-binding protein